MLAVLKDQVISEGGLEGLLTLDNVGMGECSMDLEFMFQIFPLLVVEVSKVNDLDGVRFVGLSFFVGFVDFAAVALAKEVGFFIKVISYPLLLFGNNLVQVKFGAGQDSISGWYRESPQCSFRGFQALHS